jgi:ABC-type nitrate/sulfonate/bicarbonate transport system substrate-binding protein
LASFNKAHPDVTYGVARAITRATMLIGHDPDAARQATRPFLKSMDDATFNAAWAAYLPVFPTNPDITEASYAKELEFEKAVLPASDAAVPYDQVVDASFVRRAMQELAH